MDNVRANFCRIIWEIIWEIIFVPRETQGNILEHCREFSCLTCETQGNILENRYNFDRFRLSVYGDKRPHPGRTGETGDEGEVEHYQERVVPSNRHSRTCSVR